MTVSIPDMGALCMVPVIILMACCSLLELDFAAVEHSAIP